MVTNVTSLTGNGLKDWLIQRVTAVYFAVYSIFVLTFLFMHPQLEYAQWHLLFANPVFQIASYIALFTVSLHAYIGLWTVSTDYINCTILRVKVQMLIALWLIAQFIWGIMIVGGH